MHVLINGWFWNRPDTGSGQYVRRLVSALATMDRGDFPKPGDLGVRLTVLVPSRHPDQRTDPPQCPGFCLTSHPIGKTHLDKLRWEQMVVPRMTHKLDTDVLHVPYWAPPITSPTPVIVTAHDIIPLVLPAYRGGAAVRLYTALVSATTSRARVILTDSEASRRDILAHLHVPPDRVRTVPLAVGEAFTPEPTPQDAHFREALQLPSRYVLYLGGFDARKNLPVALRAFGYARQACPEAVLVIAGRLPESDSAFMPDPRRLVREANLPDQAVRFLGFVSESQKPALYRGARAFILPSRYEGFGYPALEALACGVPVVGSDATSVPEVVGDAGVLLSPDDAEGMGGALIQILIDDEFHAALQQRAIDQSRRFSWTRTAEGTLAAYRDALV